MHDGYKSQDKFQTVLEQFSRPKSKFAPFVFWFYDQDLTTVGIKPQEMARELAKKGFNPGYAHARPNYAWVDGHRDSEHIQVLPHEQWLSELWFDVMEQQVRQAEVDGSHVSFTDEFGWPSLQADGQLVRDDPTLQSKNLRFEYVDLEPGETVELEGHFFSVSAKKVGTEQTSFITYDNTENWKRIGSSFDQCPPDQNNAEPINMASHWSEPPHAYCEYHVNIPEDGVYRLYATWGQTGNNTEKAAYVAGEQTFAVNQKENVFCWNHLGEVGLSRGMQIIRLQNMEAGRLSADAVKLISKDGREIIVDDLQTTDRIIAYLDADSLTVRDEKSFQATEPCRVYLFDLQAYRGYDGGNVDYLSRRVVDLFMEIAWKPYFDRFASLMGAGLPMNGIFSDHEGDYGYKMAWSDDFRDLFQSKYGEDIRRILPLLIDRDVQGKDVVWRYRWFDTVSDMYAELFHKLSDEAAKHGVYFTMHTWEESLQLQASCVGDIYKLNRGISLPGTDALCRVAYNPQNFKDHYSIAEFEGVRFMNEVMALNGPDRYTPEELKKQGNCLAAYGVSHVVNHAVKMTREYAQSSVPPDFYHIDPCWQAMGQYTDFIRRISYVNSLGRAHAEVLVLNPMDSMYALAENDVFDMNFEMLAEKGGIPKINASFGGEAGEINRQYGELIRILTRQRVEHLTADKEYMRRMEVCGERLCYKDYSFHTVVVPRMTMIDLETAEKLTRLAQNGGEIYWIGNPPTATLQNGRNDPALASCMDLLAQCGKVHFLKAPAELDLRYSVQVLDGADDLLCHWRIIDGRHFLFLCHNDNNSAKATVYLPGITGRAILLNPATGERTIPETRKEKDGLCVCLEFAAYGSWYLVIEPGQEAEAVQGKTLVRKIPLEAFTAEIARGNTEKLVTHTIAPIRTSKMRLILRKGCFDDPTHPDVAEIFLCRDGEVVLHRRMQQEFTVEFDEVKAIELEFSEQEIDEIRIISEKGLTSYRMEAWERAWWHTVAELDTYSQSELINPVAYPAGTYDVSLTDWSEWEMLSGLFAGVVRYRTAVTLTEADLDHHVKLNLTLGSGSVGVTVNGQDLGCKLFPPFSFDMRQYLHAGENVIELRVSNTILSNVCGKHGGLLGAEVLLLSTEACG